MKSGGSRCNHELASNVRRGGGRKEEEKEGLSDKIQQPLPGRWGKRRRLNFQKRSEFGVFCTVGFGICARHLSRISTSKIAQKLMCLRILTSTGMA